MKTSVRYRICPAAVTWVQYMLLYLPFPSISSVPLQLSIVYNTHLVLLLLLNSYLEKLSLKITPVHKKTKKYSAPKQLIECNLNSKILCFYIFYMYFYIFSIKKYFQTQDLFFSKLWYSFFCAWLWRECQCTFIFLKKKSKQAKRGFCLRSTKAE